MARNLEVKLMNEVVKGLIRHTQWWVDRFTQENEVPKTYSKWIEVCFSGDQKQYEDAVINEFMKQAGVVISVDLHERVIQLIDGTTLTFDVVFDKVKTLYEKNIEHRTATM